LAKEYGNFDHIKLQMMEQKKKAEQVSSVPKTENRNHKQTQKEVETFTINITPPVDKIEKKAVNYYLSKSLIKRIKKGAKQYNKRDSIFLEEVMDQVLQSMGL